MLRRLLPVALGAAGALQLDRWLSRQKVRLRPSSLTGAFFDTVNRKLEKDRASSSTTHQNL